MGWFFSKQQTEFSMNELCGNPEPEDDTAAAEAWLREQSSDGHITALVRHYGIADVTDHIHQFAGVQISDEATVEIVSKLRREYGVRPLQDHEMPGYIDPDEYPEDQEDMRAHHADRNERRSRGISPLAWLSGRR